MGSKLDPCMFCGELPCVCNGPSKRPAAKKRAPRKTEPEKGTAKKLPSRKPLAEPRTKSAPPVARQRLTESKVNIDEQVAKKSEPQTKKLIEYNGSELDEELQYALRMFESEGMLHEDTRKKYKRYLKRPAPTGELFKYEGGEGVDE